MDRRSFLWAAPLLFFATAAAASEGGESKTNKQVGQYVDLQPIGLPVIIEGQLINYVFVNIRLNLAQGADTSRWRAKEPFFRDALVRAGYRTPFNAPKDVDKLETGRIVAALTREVSAITGPGVLKSVEVVSQTPSHRARRPS